MSVLSPEEQTASTNIIKSTMWEINLRKLSDYDLQRYKTDAFLCAKAVARLSATPGPVCKEKHEAQYQERNKGLFKTPGPAETLQADSCPPHQETDGTGVGTGIFAACRAATEVAEIEKRHRESQAGYDYDKEAIGSPLRACGPQAHQDRATLLSIIKSSKDAPGPAATGSEYNAARDWLHTRFGSHSKRGIWDKIEPDDFASLTELLKSFRASGLISAVPTREAIEEVVSRSYKFGEHRGSGPPVGLWDRVRSELAPQIVDALTALLSPQGAGQRDSSGEGE